MSNENSIIQPGFSDTRKVAYAVVLTAIAVALAPYTSFPIGIARINPTQHFINVLGAVFLGPLWAMIIAAVVGVIRNAMGVGTLLAFPGGMIGALLAGLLFKCGKKTLWAAVGEIAGTGIIAPVVSAAFVAPVLMGKAIPWLALMPSFMCSSIAGAVLGILALNMLTKAGLIDICRVD